MAGEAAADKAALWATPCGSSPVPGPVHQAAGPPNRAAQSAAAAAVLAIPISPSASRSRSGEPRETAIERGEAFGSGHGGRGAEVGGRAVEVERDHREPAPAVRQSWLIAAPPASKLATIWAVTAGG